MKNDRINRSRRKYQENVCEFMLCQQQKRSANDRMNNTFAVQFNKRKVFAADVHICGAITQHQFSIGK